MRALCALVLAVLLAACGQAPPTASAQESARVQKLRAFIEANNRHDTDAMLAATIEDFRWLQVQGDQTVIEVAGHEPLRSWLEGYFQSTPDARTTLGAVISDGDYVSAVETVRWRDANGAMQEQSAMSVYEFAEDDRLSRAWYFPASRETPP